MKQRSRANALLIELVLVIFFFMLGSTVLVRLFADARHRTIQARATNVSMAAAQNVADHLERLVAFAIARLNGERNREADTEKEGRKNQVGKAEHIFVHSCVMQPVRQARHAREVVDE